METDVTNDKQQMLDLALFDERIDHRRRVLPDFAGRFGQGYLPRLHRPGVPSGCAKLFRY